jgi:transposase
MKSVSVVEVGIDVSKDFLDVCIDGGRPFRVPNTPEGCNALAERLPSGATVHLESSGGYERVPRRLLGAAGFQVRTHDPLKVRRMAQAKGQRGKTDALDARHLSGEGRSLTSQPEKSPEREALCDISRTIGELKATAAQLKTRAGLPALEDCARGALLRSADAIGLQVRILEKEYLGRVKASTLRQRHSLALTVPGVGPCLARVVSCELPESIEPFTDAQLTSYAGVAPIDDQSGKKKAPARIGRGNSRIKGALYMPALCCIRRQEWAKDLYARLRARGRVHQQAVVAVMRRLLLRILDVIRRGTPWVDKRPAT